MATTAFLVSTVLPLVGLGGFGGVILGTLPKVRLGVHIIGLMKSIGGREGLSPEELARLEHLENNLSDAQRFVLDDWP